MSAVPGGTTGGAELPNVDISMAARQYVSAGWVLVPIARGSKGPNHSGWNLRSGCIDDDPRATKMRGGVGLAHAFSGTCCIDLDDLAASRKWLAERGIDIDTLMVATDAVQIASGRENRGKLLYRHPELVDPMSLVTVRVADCGLELRCATRDGKTVQDVLPPTIHPDTQLPYTWAGTGAWQNLPVLPAALLEVWLGLASTVDPARGPSGAPDGDPEADPVVGHLQVADWVLAALRDGTRHIRCPFEAEHTSKGKVGDCSYFPAMTGGYARGHFHCLHAHCAERTDDEFLEGVGYDRHAAILAMCEVLTDDPGEDTRASAQVAGANAAGATGAKGLRTAQDLPLPPFDRDKYGVIYAIINNLLMGLARPDVCGCALARDLFRDEIVMAPPRTADQWIALGDDDYTHLRAVLESGACGFAPIGREMIRDAVSLVARRHQFDSAILWLESKGWDGVARIASFCHRYLGTADTPYHTAVSRYLWTALAGRVLEPGCKADMVPILIGAQGTRKTSAVIAMVPAPEHYIEIDLGADEADLARKMRGAIIAEFAELKGLRTRELEHVKAFISRQHENWTPKFKEFNQTYPRRCVFVGTTNHEEFLDDDTGNRRWLPVRVGTIDTDAIARDRDQLWAEGARYFEVGGVDWREAENLAGAVHAEHIVSDTWEDQILAWIDAPSDETGVIRKLEGFTLSSMLFGAIGLTPKDQTRANQLRAGAVLRAFGLEKKPMRFEEKIRKVWVVTLVTHQEAKGNDMGNKDIPF